jgi:hypothetical protein
MDQKLIFRFMRTGGNLIKLLDLPGCPWVTLSFTCVGAVRSLLAG